MYSYHSGKETEHFQYLRSPFSMCSPSQSSRPHPKVSIILVSMVIISLLFLMVLPSIPKPYSLRLPVLDCLLIYLNLAFLDWYCIIRASRLSIATLLMIHSFSLLYIFHCINIPKYFLSILLLMILGLLPVWGCYRYCSYKYSIWCWILDFCHMHVLHLLRPPQYSFLF